VDRAARSRLARREGQRRPDRDRSLAADPADALGGIRGLLDEVLAPIEEHVPARREVAR
jgi:hypothetical protein